MEDITAIKVKEISQKANDSVLYSTLRFPYLNSYKDLNKEIIEKAKIGETSIYFDFIDNTSDNDKSLGDIKKNHNRIYSKASDYALRGVYDYPSYLISRGFNVEVRKSIKKHGYISKTYFISW